MMADCRTCATRITSLRDGWVHLVNPAEGSEHDPEPPLSHAWHRRQLDTHADPLNDDQADNDLFTTSNWEAA